MKNKTLLIGCGGSGITTLLRFNEMLAGNPACRKDIWEGISYMVLDTEVSKTETFEKEIHRQMGGSKMPIIKLVKVTKGFKTLDEIVGPNFDLQKDQNKISKLKQHWWYSPSTDANGNPFEGIPFRAQEIYPIEAGAGQCGLVSYLATWNYLPTLENDIESVLSDIKNHNIGKTLDGLRVYIVTGTAGGTGRGSWNLVAFKIRQYLKEHGVTVMPEGIFFDSSCFKSTSKQNPDEEISKQLNSITAFSELSAWMRLRQGRGDFLYRLPNLSDPDADGTTDVIAVPSNATNHEKSPVSAAYMIFGNNGGASLKDNKQYHEMAAAGLYAMVAGEEYVDPTKINRLERLGSFAATTFEVDTVNIRRYMENAVRQEYAEQLAAGASVGGVLDKETDKIVGTMSCAENADLDPEGKTFFGETKFCVPRQVDAQSIAPADSKKASLLQLLIGKVSEEMGLDGDGNFIAFKSLETDMRAGRRVDHKSLGRKVLRTLQMEDFEDEYGNVVENFLKSRGLNDDNLVEKMRTTVIGAFAPGENYRPSVGRAINAVDKLIRAFRESKENLVGNPDEGRAMVIYDDTLKVEVSSSEDAAQLYVKGPYEKAATENGLFERQFTDQEIEGLKKCFQDFMRYSVFFHVRSVLARKFDRSIAALADMRKSLEAVSDMLNQVALEFRETIRKDFEVSKYEEVRNILFTDEDDESVLEDLPKANAQTNVYKRLLKPIMSEREVAAILRDPANQSVNAAPIRQRLSDEIVKIVGNGYPSLEDAKYVLRKAFIELIRNNVSLASSKSSDFMDRNFSFAQILERNVRYWNMLLDHRKGSSDQMDVITDRFRVFLGVEEGDYAEEDGRLRLDSGSLLTKIATSMVSTCTPWIEISAGQSTTFLFTLILLPIELNDASEKELESELDKKLGRTCKIIHRGSRADGGMSLPKDRIVTYASAGVNDPKDPTVNPMSCIKSLDYWRTPALKSRLVLAESKAGLCYFQQNEAGMKNPYIERSRALGFMSPLFVKDPEFSALRWKPWGDGGKEDAMLLQGRKVDEALLFAFLGCGASDELRSLVGQYGWPCGEGTGFPLLKMGAARTTESFPFMREHVEWRDGKVKNSLSTGIWQAGELLENSIDHVSEYLAGNGRPGEEATALRRSQEDGNAKREAILLEAKCFEDNIVPMLGIAKYKELKEARHAWLTDQQRKASADDKRIWDRLLAASTADLSGK